MTLQVAFGNGGSATQWYLTSDFLDSSSALSWLLAGNPVDGTGTGPVDNDITSGSFVPVWDNTSLFNGAVVADSDIATSTHSFDVTGAWNSVKNAIAYSDDAENLLFKGFVHVDVVVGQDSDADSSITVINSKRGNIVTGNGDDTVQIDLATNNSDWSNEFRVGTGAGDDVVEFGAGTFLGKKAYDGTAVEQTSQWNMDVSGKYTKTFVDTGAGNDTAIGHGSMDFFLGGDGNDLLVGNGGNDTLVGDGGMNEPTVQQLGTGDASQTGVITTTSSFYTAGIASFQAINGRISLGGDYLAINNHLTNADSPSQVDLNESLRISFSQPLEGVTIHLNALDGVGVNGRTVAEGISYQINGTGAWINFYAEDGTSESSLTLTGNITSITLRAANGNTDSFNIKAFSYFIPGNDTVLGGDGNDQLFGGEGNDFIDAGRGNDQLFGGFHDDVFNFKAADGLFSAASTDVKTINDFEVLNDVVRLEGFSDPGLTAATFASWFAARAVISGGDVVMQEAGSASKIVFANAAVDYSNFSLDNFDWA